MSYNGSGTFLINTAGQPVVSGTVISSTAFNALTADLATGLSTAITKDGQTTITANIPMANYKFTGLGTGSAAGDSANLSQVQSTAVKLLASVSGADTITAVGSPNVAAYAAGQMFYFVAAAANTGAVTINIDSLGAKSITRDGTTALAAGDIQSGEVCVIVYDGTQFQLVNGASQSASIVTENLTVNKATVLNESGGDNDTRIEGDTDANLVFVDASADAIGIGTSSPAAKLHATGAILSSGALVALSASNIFIDQASSTLSRLGVAGPNASTYGTLRISQYSSNGSLGRDVLDIDSSGNLGLGVTPTSDARTPTLQVGAGGSFRSESYNATNNQIKMVGNGYEASDTSYKYLQSDFAALYVQINGEHRFSTAASGTAGNAITFTERARITSGGNLLVGTTSDIITSGRRLSVLAGGGGIAAAFKNDVISETINIWNAATSGDNVFIDFDTETAVTSRGSISYNRAGGLVAYNTTSDYRAKDVYGPVQNSGEQIDALKVYRGKMKGATLERPMMMAHEAQEVVPYAVGGEKDAVNEDGTPKYQTMDHQILVPLLIAEIQTLRARVAALEAK